ncbi:MAG: hypothetical protein IJT25_01815 [Clostridia bacterium]|nr:hypothetical protein [Clostridia bacterium]
MKKFVVIIVFGLIIMVLFSLSFNINFESENSFNIKNGVYVKASNEKNASNENDLGFVLEALGTSINGIKKYYKNEDIVGEFFEVEKSNFNLELLAQKLGLSVIKRTYINNTENIYCYSPVVPYGLEGLNSNIQISINNNSVIVATPIIYGSF